MLVKKYYVEVVFNLSAVQSRAIVPVTYRRYGPNGEHEWANVGNAILRGDKRYRTLKSKVVHKIVIDDTDMGYDKLEIAKQRIIELGHSLPYKWVPEHVWGEEFPF